MEKFPIKVLFFGEAHHLAGKREDTVEIPLETTYEDIRNAVFQKFTSLQRIEQIIMIAVDQEYGSPAQQFQLDTFSEIAVIPPLSGG